MKALGCAFTVTCVILEAVGNTRTDQPWIELGLAADFRAADQGGIELGLQEQLLDVEVHAPMLVEHVVEANLQRAAECILDLEIFNASRILIVEHGVVHARADIRLEGTEIGEVILQGEGRSERNRL